MCRAAAPLVPGAFAVLVFARTDKEPARLRLLANKSFVHQIRNQNVQNQITNEVEENKRENELPAKLLNFLPASWESEIPGKP